MKRWQAVPGLQVAIDGPSGSGKGTLAANLAEAVNLPVLDTGLLYRLTGAVAVQRGIALDDDAALAELLDEMLGGVGWTREGVTFEGEDWTPRLRGEDAGAAASQVAARQVVRAKLLGLQRQLASSGCVMDGRDIGTVVLPDAQAKFFLTASQRERARRRWAQLQGKNSEVSLDDVLGEIKKRDQRDTEREYAPLCAAEDAITIDSTTMRIDQVLDRMLAVLERRGLISPAG
ncbi:MAG TPA: (d)CMP kinase [Mariprofundaceae bacterium]|nr:(d)CMP kinase [Mariprofundaceae bacterium]